MFHQQLKQSIIWRGFYFVTLLIVNIFLSRFVQADGVGTIFYLSNFFSLLVLILSFNLDGSFTYFNSSKTIHHNQLAFVAISWTLLITILTLSFLPQYFHYFDKDIIAADTNASKYGFHYIIGILLINYFTALFYSLGNYFLPNIILGITNLLLIALIYFGSNHNAPAGAITKDYFFFILLQGIALAIAFMSTQKDFKHFSLPNIKQLKQLYKYAAIALSGNFIFFFVYRIDYWFVKQWCHQTGDLGNYIQASKLSQMLLILPQILASSIFPQIASGQQHNEIVKDIIRIFKLFLLLYIFLFITLLIAGRWFFPFVFGASFSTMYLPMLILLPGVFCLSISAIFSAYFSGKKQNKFNVYAALFALAIMISLTVILKNKYSIYIAASISSIAYFAESLYCFIKFSQQEKLSLNQLFVFKKEDLTWVKKLFG